MMNKIKQLSRMLLLLFFVAACSPQELDDYALDSIATLTDDQVSFTQTVSPTSDNMITFTSTTQLPANGVYTIRWDLGNGSSGNKSSVTGIYPFAGDYTVTLSIYFPDGSVAKKSAVVTIAKDDYSLVDTPVYRNLTGGSDNAEGKTWVFDQYHPGHFGVGPVDPANGDNMSPSWWSAPANAKDGSSLYTQEFTFIQNGTKLVWKNNGKIYTNSAGVEALGNPSGTIENPGGVGDFDVPYVPESAYTFSLDEASMTLTLNNGAFFGHYTGASVFTIVSLTEDELYVYCDSKVEVGNRWWYRLIPKEKNVRPPLVVKAVPLSENFEVSPPKLAFVGQDMGEKGGVVDNPLPLPINESAKVYRYQKTKAFYTNLFWVAPDYKFDLTTQNKIRLKVMIPSYNDYTTENEIAGDWISEKRLRPQLAVKLQNSELGDNAWSTQTEIVKANLESDKWLELEFDFSGVADRTDYDKIVIQFGGEGHAGPGFFFFDDFAFTE